MVAAAPNAERDRAGRQPAPGPQAAQGASRVRQLVETLGIWLGGIAAHFADFCDFRHLLVLGRVTSGEAGEMLLRGARAVLEAEFPELAARLTLHLPGETEKRHGQAIAAASLPALD